MDDLQKKFYDLTVTACEGMDIMPTTVEELTAKIENSMKLINEAAIVAHEIEMKKLRSKKTK